MSFHFLVRFEPMPEKAGEFREELLRVVESARICGLRCGA